MSRLGRILLIAIATAAVLAQVGPASASTRKPKSVSHLRASSTVTSISLTWHNRGGKSLKSIVVRYVKGTKAPATRRSGLKLATVKKSRHSYTKHGLRAGSRYAFSVFAVDKHGHYSRAAKLVVATKGAATAFDGHWSGKATAPGTTDVSEPVTFTVSNGKVVNFQGWIYGLCSNGSLDDVYLSGPAPIKANGSVARAESITPTPGYTATSSMIGFFHGATANGTIEYVFAGCAESPWTWKAARS